LKSKCYHSISGDNGFINGTGSSFTLISAAYETNIIQVKQTDAAGNVSNTNKNTSRIVVDTADPIFDLQPTTVNILVNAPIATTVYDAHATNLNGGNADEVVTYSIKGTNVNKFSIAADTGILTSPAFLPLITKPCPRCSFTDTVISCSASLPATSVATMVTISLSSIDAPQVMSTAMA
jgi:hypothetical protein